MEQEYQIKEKLNNSKVIKRLEETSGDCLVQLSVESRALD